MGVNEMTLQTENRIQVISKIANDVLNNKIIPYCEEKKLSFMVVNGIPRLLDKNNHPVNLPNFMVRLYEITNEFGEYLVYQILKDAKYTPTTKVTKEYSNKGYLHLTRNRNRSLSLSALVTASSNRSNMQQASFV